MNTRAYLAEVLGTFLFLTIGYLSVAAFGVTDAPGLLVVPFSFSFGLLAAIMAFGHVSGGHYNPAVTVAAIIDGRLPAVDAIGYIVAQLVGALAAAAVVFATVSQDAVAAGITRPSNGVTEISALIMEVILTAGFVIVILTVTKRLPILASLVIPLSLVAIHFAAAPLSGASVNPVRSIGSAVVGGDMASIWIYLVGPIVGGVIGALVYRFVSADTDADDEAAARTADMSGVSAGG